MEGDDAAVFMELNIVAAENPEKNSKKTVELPICFDLNVGQFEI